MAGEPIGALLHDAQGLRLPALSVFTFADGVAKIDEGVFRDLGSFVSPHRWLAWQMSPARDVSFDVIEVVSETAVKVLVQGRSLGLTFGHAALDGASTVQIASSLADGFAVGRRWVSNFVAEQARREILALSDLREVIREAASYFVLECPLARDRVRIERCERCRFLGFGSREITREPAIACLHRSGLSSYREWRRLFP